MAIIFNVCKCFERQASKSKYIIIIGPSQVTSKTAEATGYSERTVRRIVGEKASLCGTAFTSPARQYWVDDGLQEEHIEEFIIRLGDDGDDESSSDTSGQW